MSIETGAILGDGAHLKKCHRIQPIEFLLNVLADSLVEGFCGLGREEFPAGNSFRQRSRTLWWWDSLDKIDPQELLSALLMA